MFSEKKINNVIVKPLINSNISDPNKVKGGQIFAEPYNTTFLCAKRKSGKTSALGEIISKTTDKRTIIWIFCPTTGVDESWKTIISNLEKRGNQVNVFDSMFEGKVNQLDEIITSLLEPVPIKVKESEQPIGSIKIKFGDTESGAVGTKKEYKPKKIAPEHCFILDDLSNEYRSSKGLYTLLKNGRHLKASVYVSMQWCLDVLPAGWKNAQYVLCFKSFSREKLEHIHKHLDLTIDLDKFFELYDYVMSQANYDFLYIDVRNQKYRRNFNKEINVE